MCQAFICAHSRSAAINKISGACAPECHWENNPKQIINQRMHRCKVKSKESSAENRTEICLQIGWHFSQLLSGSEQQQSLLLLTVLWVNQAVLLPILFGGLSCSRNQMTTRARISKMVSFICPEPLHLSLALPRWSLHVSSSDFL